MGTELLPDWYSHQRIFRHCRCLPLLLVEGMGHKIKDTTNGENYSHGDGVVIQWRVAESTFRAPMHPQILKAPYHHITMCLYR